MLRALFQGADFSLYPHKGQRSFLSLFFKNKGTDLIHEGSALMTQSLPKGPFPNAIILVIRFQQMSLGGGGDTTFSLQQYLKIY